MSIKSFLDEFDSLTDPNPIGKGRFLRVSEGSTDFVLFEASGWDGGIRLSSIYSLYRGEGNGSKGLEWFNALADKHQMKITGAVTKFGRAKDFLSNRQLVKWYQRHGYTYNPKTVEIWREPKWHV